MKLAIVGVTGMVGKEMLEVLSERDFPLTELIPVASEKSCGNTISYLGKDIEIVSLDDLMGREIDLALFSAGGGVSIRSSFRLITGTVPNGTGMRSSRGGTPGISPA